MFGIPRLQASDVSASALDNNFEFYVARGTFGTINNGQDITIPAGTQIYTAQGLSGQVVLTANPVTCPASQSSAPFAVTNLQAAPPATPRPACSPTAASPTMPTPRTARSW